MTAALGHPSGSTPASRVDGQVPPGFGTALIRDALPFITLVGWLFDQPLAGWTSLAATSIVSLPVLGPSRQGLHDRLADTVVVRDRVR